MSLLGRMSPTDFSRVVVSSLVAEGGLGPGTLEQQVSAIERFGVFAENGLGIASIGAVGPRHAEQFLESRLADGRSPEFGSRKIRRTALRKAFKIGRKLGLVDSDPTLDLEVGPNSPLRARPLTDQEIEGARPYAARSPTDLRRSIAWALAEATGHMNEIGLVTVADVELPQVRLPGSSTVDPRWATLTEWGAAHVERRLRTHIEGEKSLIVWRSPPKFLFAASRQAVTETLRQSGLLASDVKPRSIIAWRGRKEFEAGKSIDEVARLLGYRSLDQTATFIRFEWRGR